MASVFTFLRTQGSLILMGMLLLGGIVTQIQSARRYHKLRKEIAGMAACPAFAEGTGRGAGAEFSGQAAGQQEMKYAEPKRAMRGVRYQQEQEEEEILDEQEEPPVSTRRAPARKSDAKNEAVKSASDRQSASKRATVDHAAEEDDDEIDGGLLQLKQSLERIAVSRDQKAEEQPHRGRVLTPAEQKIIADILSEYLA